jgi:hypothetical protein
VLNAVRARLSRPFNRSSPVQIDGDIYDFLPSDGAAK